MDNHEASFTADSIVRWMDIAAQQLDEACPLLTELDAARGDADHGFNMRDGFARIAADLHANAPVTAEDGLLKAAAVLRRTMGGTSGALWASALRRAGKAVSGITDASAGIAVVLCGMAEAVEDIGGARVGENTMLDALRPAADAAKQAVAAHRPLNEVAELAVSAASDGAQSTAGRVATKGRASYLGERATAGADPGATSAAIVVGALRDALTDHHSDQSLA